MTKDLVPFNADQLPSTDLTTDTQLAELTTGTDFLPRVQLVTKGKYVDTQKISPGRYGVPQPGGEEILDLGEKMDILPLAVRAKALDMGDRDAIIAVYDMNLPEFDRIKTASAVQNSNCMWGPSFLVVERRTGKFYEYFMGNKSARQESSKLLPFLPLSREKAEMIDEKPHGPLPCTLSCRYVKKPDYGWHVPVVTKCSEPFTSKELPDIESIKEEITKFAASKDNGVERVPDEENVAAGRAR